SRPEGDESGRPNRQNMATRSFLVASILLGGSQHSRLHKRAQCIRALGGMPVNRPSVICSLSSSPHAGGQCCSPAATREGTRGGKDRRKKTLDVHGAFRHAGHQALYVWILLALRSLGSLLDRAPHLNFSAVGHFTNNYVAPGINSDAVRIG